MNDPDTQAAPSAPAFHVTASRYETLPTGAVQPSPDNPRDPIREDDPETLSLAESIRHAMQLEPILVRDTGGPIMDILAGERRWVACRLVGKPVEARIVQCDDRSALQITVIENLQRKNLSPLEEARGIATLMRRGYSEEQVCRELGQTPAWVAKRSQLVHLEPAWADHLRTRWTWAGIGHLEQIARLPADAQRELAAQLADEADDFDPPPTVKELSDRIAERYLRSLKSATWQLDDADLVPAAGACAACPKRSNAQTLLWSDLPSVGGVRCTDAQCWRTKAAAQSARAATELAQRHARVIVLADTGMADPPAALPAAVVTTERAHWHGAEKVAKSAPGAVPVIDGATGQVSYQRPRDYASSAVKRLLGAPEQPATRKPGESARAAADLRLAKRYSWRITAAAKAKGKAPMPSEAQLLRLVVCLVLDAGDPLRKGTWEHVLSTKRCVQDDRDALWEAVRDQLPGDYHRVVSTHLPDLEAVQAIERLVGLNPERQGERAMVEVPEPGRRPDASAGSGVPPQAAAKTKPQAAAKTKPKPKPKPKASGAAKSRATAKPKPASGAA